MGKRLKMTRMKKFGLLVCVTGLIVWGAGNFPCHAQNAVDPGKVSGYTGNNLTPVSTNGNGFNWKYGFSGSNGRYGNGMYTGSVIYESAPVGYGAGPVVGMSNCGSACGQNCCEADGTVYNTSCGLGYGNSCFGVMPLVRDVAHVAFAPVYWVASLLSCGTYGDCGCVPVPYRAPCNPCDNYGNWIGCGVCGGAGCVSCGNQGKVVTSGVPLTSEMITDGAVTEEVPAPSENLPAKAIERNQPVPAGPAKAQPGKSTTGGSTTIVVPVQPMVPQAGAKMNPRIPGMVSSQQQTPSYIFVTPEGQVIPQDQVREFAKGNQKGKVQYKIANQNGVRPVNYERQVPRGTVHPQGAKRMVTEQPQVVTGQGWQTVSGSQRYPMAAPQRKYSSGKF